VRTTHHNSRLSSGLVTASLEAGILFWLRERQLSGADYALKRWHQTFERAFKMDGGVDKLIEGGPAAERQYLKEATRRF
jgi:hypothetical protein